MLYQKNNTLQHTISYMSAPDSSKKYEEYYLNLSFGI